MNVDAATMEVEGAAHELKFEVQGVDVVELFDS
jgi:hypothetical protein